MCATDNTATAGATVAAWNHVMHTRFGRFTAPGTFELEISALAARLTAWSEQVAEPSCVQQQVISAWATAVAAVSNDAQRSDMSGTDPWDATSTSIPAAAAAGKRLVAAFGLKIVVADRLRPITNTPAHAPSVPRTSKAASPVLYCKVESMGPGGLEFEVDGGATGYTGLATVTFSMLGSGDVFPDRSTVTVHAPGSMSNWHPVPADDIGASAAPNTCSAQASR